MTLPTPQAAGELDCPPSASRDWADERSKAMGMRMPQQGLRPPLSRPGPRRSSRDRIHFHRFPLPFSRLPNKKIDYDEPRWRRYLLTFLFDGHIWIPYLAAEGRWPFICKTIASLLELAGMTSSRSVMRDPQCILSSRLPLIFLRLYKLWKSFSKLVARCYRTQRQWPVTQLLLQPLFFPHSTPC